MKLNKQLVVIFAVLFIILDISTLILTKDINNTVSNYSKKEDNIKDNSNVVSNAGGSNNSDDNGTGVSDEDDGPIKIDTTPPLIVTDNSVTCPLAKFGYSTQDLTVTQTYSDVSDGGVFPLTSTLGSVAASKYLMLANYSCDAGELETGIMPFVYDDLTISTANKNGVVVLDEIIYSYVLDYLTENLGEDDVQDAKINEVRISDKNCIKIVYTVGENVYHNYAISYGKNFFIVKGVLPLSSSADIESPMQEIVRTLSVAN